ncbi:hypothetical protein NQ176_g2303 [Zarea fungicola]|uniref:Uncharacterized protein n=1 Tax=Zarea fungicola TaxID=93591 RepID=A0ACC1NQ53_9HYPO|nr:hypothetical protein NQ176_g2303 [Lecanicillium fungicola]
MANFVITPDETRLTSRLGYLEFVPAMMGTIKHCQAFSYSFAACALASLHNRYGPSISTAHMAQWCYTKALRATSITLQDPREALQDHTLAAILLLSHYEHIAAQSLNMEAWDLHVGAAIELAKLRGPEQTLTKEGTFVPTHIDWWMSELKDGWAWHFQRLTADTGQLKAEADELLSSISDNLTKRYQLEHLSEKVKLLDQEIATSLQRMPKDFHWKSVSWQERVERHGEGAEFEFQAFPGPIDMYPDLWIANLWNVMRSMRLVLSSIELRCVATIISPQDYRTTIQYNDAVKIRTKLIDSVISSVPYHFGWIQKYSNFNYPAEMATFECGEDSADKVLGGYFLLYPLARILNEDCISDTQREWVRHQLRYIGDRLGIRYAKALSQVRQGVHVAATQHPYDFIDKLERAINVDRAG